MTVLRTLGAALLTLVTSASVVDAAPRHPKSKQPPPPALLALDTSRSWGVWEGWGTSLCWWANVLGERDDVADLLFTLKDTRLEGKTYPGLGMTIARYNAGACSPAVIDGRKMVVSKIIPPFRQIEAFWVDGKNPDPASPSWNWNADARQRAMLVKAKQRGADRFELFSNSPPWWMCINDNPSGADKASQDNLRPAHYDDFVHYLTMVAQRSKTHWGVEFTTVAAFNEPSASFWFADGKQEGAHFSHRVQIEILRRLRPALDKAGLGSVNISSSDESFYDQASATWKALPADVRAFVTQVNVHGYQPRGDRAKLRQLANVEGGKPIWNSEHGDAEHDGLHMARVLHRDFHDLQVLAWCYWQPFDGGNKGGWGFFDADLMKGTIGKVNPKLYVFAQYSRHLRPGMRLIETADNDTIAALDPKGGRLVLVLFNDSDKAHTRAIDLAKIELTPGAKARRWLTAPQGTARYERIADLAPETGKLYLPLPPYSIQTIELDVRKTVE